MQEHAYAELHRLEQPHWWYMGTRYIYHTLLQRYVSRSRGPVLDLGCGTGGNLELLATYGPVVGLEPWGPALQFCPSTASGLVQGIAERLPFREGTFRLVAMLGVLEHVADDVGMLREARRVCQPSGTLLILTSAFMFLWSDHDEANRHVRRYTARELRAKVESVGLRVRRLSYLNFTLFPLVTTIRLFQRLEPRSGKPHIDMWPVPEPFNTVLASLLVLEGWLMQWLALPLGVSLVAVLER